MATDDKAAGWRPRERWRGFNLLGMFIKHPGPNEDTASTGMTGDFAEDDFKWMRDWGFNFARLPLDYRYWVPDGDWRAVLADKLAPIDRALEYGQRYGVHVQVCLHRIPGYCINSPAEPRDLFTDPEALAVAAEHWAFFARRYRGVPNEALSFDLLNEPDRHDAAAIARVFAALIAAVRDEDPGRFLILNGWDCGARPVRALYGTPGVGHSMRGYAPHAVSHYRADWVTLPPEARPVWPQDARPGKRWLLEEVFAPWEETLARGEFLMANECGCYHFTPHAVALSWLGDFFDLWKERDIGWALWNLRGPFGVLDSGRADVAYEDFHGHKLDRALLALLERS
ncbi:MAG: cellulase family glycosylhydrolase [Planctomycetes bacterium]|nr:cellulase family glycosylhydrolase [Planctomycetota bacterium]